MKTKFAKIHFNEATLDKRATEFFCANHQILSSKGGFAIFSCFENVILVALYDRDKIILLICQILQRRDSFIIPIEKSAFLTV